MTIPAVHCEARKVAYRQTKDGLVVSFVVHPNDMPDALAVAPLGQRYMLALAAIGDDEQPLPPTAATTRKDATLGGAAAVGGDRTIRSEQGKARYAAASDMEKALIRAARLPKDDRFRAWVTRKEPAHASPANEGEAADFIRLACCAGASRRSIAEDQGCFAAFMAMETEYLIEAGILPEPR